MKPFLENLITKGAQQSIMAFVVNPPAFDFYWHYHPAYELTLIVKGKGRRLIGDSHADFEEGDLVLIGPGLPHTWVTEKGLKGRPEAVVIQFSDAFIERFSGLDELHAISQLLVRAKHGLSFRGKASGKLLESIKRFPQASGVERVTGLLQVLGNLSGYKAISLASAQYQPLKGKENENRINTVCQYVQKHATEPLNLHKAASLIHLTPSAFCKFFKRITGQTFSDYVNDIRIANVCRQLMATDKQVAEIAYGNGFETLTYFNRVFLRKMKMQPGAYRRVYRSM